MTKNIAERAAKAIASAVSWQAFWTYGFTPLVGVATFALGAIERIPLMWAVMAGTVSFAMTGLGLLAFYQWRVRRSAEHKIVFQRSLVSRPGENVNRIILGFVMKNTADFPIEATLTKMNTVVAYRVPHAPRDLPHTIRVDASNEFMFTGMEIDVTGVADDPMRAEMDFEVMYGRSGNKKYLVAYTQMLSIPIDVKGPFQSYAKKTPNEQPGRLSASSNV